MPAGSHYEASASRASSSATRIGELWTTPIRVPVLDLETYAGGLKPLKEGGGNQTKNLRLGAHGGDRVRVPAGRQGQSRAGRSGWPGPRSTRSSGSGEWPVPGGRQVIAPIVAAVGVPHATPTFVVAPNDSSFGKYRKDFVHRLATIEEFPNKPDDAPGFARRVGHHRHRTAAAAARQPAVPHDRRPRVPHDPSRRLPCRRHGSSSRQLEMGAIRLEQVRRLGADRARSRSRVQPLRRSVCRESRRSTPHS